MPTCTASCEVGWCDEGPTLQNMKQVRACIVAVPSRACVTVASLESLRRRALRAVGQAGVMKAPVCSTWSTSEHAQLLLAMNIHRHHAVDTYRHTQTRSFSMLSPARKIADAASKNHRSVHTTPCGAAT